MATKRNKEDVSKNRRIKKDSGSVATTEVANSEVTTEEKFIPETMSVHGVEKKMLTREDLLELELMDARIKQTAAQAALLSLEADDEERRVVLKLRKKRALARDIAGENQQFVDNKSRLLNRLTEKYGVNFKAEGTVYDTETRVIDFIEEPRRKK